MIGILQRREGGKEESLWSDLLLKSPYTFMFRWIHNVAEMVSRGMRSSEMNHFAFEEWSEDDNSVGLN